MLRNGDVNGLPCTRPSFDCWVRKIPWKGNGNPFQSSDLGNPMDRRAWWATVHGVTKSLKCQMSLFAVFYVLRFHLRFYLKNNFAKGLKTSGFTPRIDNLFFWYISSIFLGELSKYFCHCINLNCFPYVWASLIAQSVKNPPAIQETRF